MRDVMIFLRGRDTCLYSSYRFVGVSITKVSAYPTTIDHLKTEWLNQKAVLVPFQENVFALAVPKSIMKWHIDLTGLLYYLVPSQIRANRHVVVQHTKVSKALRPSLTQLKGLQSLQYILVGSTQDLGGYGFSEFFDTKGRLGNFGLPPACEVQIRVRRLLRPGETAPPPGQVEQIPDRLLALMEQARRQILDRSRLARDS